MLKKENFQMPTNFHDEYTIFDTINQDYKTYLFDNDFKAFLPEIFLLVAGIFLLIYGVIYTTSKKKNYPIILVNISWLSLLSLFFTLILVLNNPFINAVLFFNTLLLDDLTKFLKIVIIFSTFFCIFISFDYIKQETLNAFEYVILIIFSTASMLFLVSSADFISMYLAIELQSLCFYVIAAIKRNSEFSTEAGLKYFLLGAFSSGLLLFGCSLIYGFTGITNFSELAQVFSCGPQTLLDTISSSSNANLSLYEEGQTLLSKNNFFQPKACELGMVFILVGFLFKMTAVPFHMWAPDVYEGAPTSVTAFFSITPKAAILAIFLRLFFESFYDLMIPWQKILIICSLASMILGSFAALSQIKIKRLLAFSSIGHVGYLLSGFCCGTIEGLQALLIYLVIYIIMTLNIFSFFLLPVRRESLTKISFSSGHSIQRIKYITDLAMLSKTNPILAFTFTVTLFSMAGIPPLAGFYSKALLFFATMSSTLYVLAIVGVLTSVVSCFYYIRLIKIMYFEKPKLWCSFSTISRENAYTLACTLFFIMFFMLYPSPLYLITHKVALTFCL